MEHTDVLLAEIASRAEEDPSFSLGISILVDGIFVSGLVTSAAAFRAAIRLAGPGDEGGPDAQSESAGMPSYIHLRNVKFYAGSGQQIEERSADSFWRCRLSAVAGFKLGTLHFMAARLGENENRRRLTEA